MGQTITTPLTLTLQHWKDVQEVANNQSAEIKKKKWVTFCSTEWPTFNVGWPQGGTFDLNIIFQVKAKVMDPGPHGHPDQVPYIVTWQNLASDPPPWVKPFLILKTSLSASSLPPTLVPASPPTVSTLYPTLVKRPPTSPKPSVLPPEDGPLLDLLTERPPPYQPPPPGRLRLRGRREERTIILRHLPLQFLLPHLLLAALGRKRKQRRRILPIPPPKPSHFGPDRTATLSIGHSQPLTCIIGETIIPLFLRIPLC